MIISTDRKLIVGLEIGTTKVITLVGEIIKDGTIKIIGMGICKSKGIDKGKINNLDEVIECIKKSIHKAEITADCHITSVYLSLSSKHIKCQNEIGIVPISEDEVTQDDINNVIHTAKSVQMFHKNKMLHIIPQEYSIDKQSGIKNPIGLSGIRMQVKVHIITCHHNTSKNIIKALEKCDLKANKIIFSGLASSKSVITEDERKLGACVIDIGGGTIDLTIYLNDYIQDSQVIPYAGNIVTSDIAHAFSISYHDAEDLKIKYGAAIKLSSDILKSIDFTSMNGNTKKTIEQEALIEVIEARYTELLSLVNKRILNIQKKLYHEGLPYQLSSGIIITGGGSKIDKLKECAEKIFHKPVRIAQPLNISGSIEKVNSPNYSTAVGLLHYGKELYVNTQNKNKENSFFEKWIEKITNWFKKEF